MKRWMVKKVGTLVLSTATGLGFLTTAALGQGPSLEANELRRRPETEPAPPVPAIRSDSQDAADDLGQTETSSATTASSNQSATEVKSQSIADPEPQDSRETQSLRNTHPLGKQNVPEEPTFELPEPVETAREDEHSEKNEAPTALTQTFELPPEFAESDRPPKANSQNNPKAGVVIQPAFPSPPSAKLVPGNDEADPSVNPIENGREATSGKPSVEITPGHSAKPKTPERSVSAKKRQEKPGLDGCCPVTLRNRRQIVPGRLEHSSRWQGVAYRFASHRAQQKFEANPENYAPAHAGCDVTLIADSGEEKAGSLEHAVWYQRRLYLFQSQATRQAFSENPEKYIE